MRRRALVAPLVPFALVAITQACGDVGGSGPYQPPALGWDGSTPSGDAGGDEGAAPGDSGGADSAADTGADSAPSTCDPSMRVCAHTFTWTLPSGTSQPDFAEVRGSFEGWEPGVLPMTLKNGVWTATAQLPVGASVEYKFWAGWGSSRCSIAPCESWFTDPGDPTTAPDGNSLLQSVSCAAPACPAAAGPQLVLVAQPTIGADSYSFQVRFVPGGAALDPTKTVITLDGAPVAPGAVPYDPGSRLFSVSVPSGAAPNKYAYLFRVQDTAGRSASIFVPFWLEAAPFQWKDAFIYEAMIDRFLAGGTSKMGPNGSPTDPAGDWKGGDFGGVTQKIESGYFDAMGVNTLWISSPVLQTKDCEMGTGANAGHCLSAYHSYFPLATGWIDGSQNDPTFSNNGVTTPIDPHFGTADDLKALVNAAHGHGIRVLTDLVVNHVFADPSPPSGQSPQLAPLWVGHGSETAWFNVPYSSGTNDCGFENLWDTSTSQNPNRANCWFDSYLPDFYTANAAVNDAIARHAVWLMQEFDLDGFRVDAAKQVFNDVCIDLRSKVTAAISTGIPFYMVGEALGGIVSNVMDCVGADRLDGSVDDPLHNTIVGTILDTDGNAGTDLDNGAQYDESTWTGVYPNALMGHFFGSHDVPRAISIAAGDVGDAWNHPPPQQETSATAFDRLALAQAFLLTYDSIPILWMGDEYGQPGSFDPDNRRMMRFDGALSAQEQAALATLQKLGKARAAHSALRRGNRTRLWVDATFYAYGRVDGSDVVVAAFNFDPANSATRTMSIAPIGLTGTVTDALSGTMATVSGTSLAITLPPLTAAVFTK